MPRYYVDYTMAMGYGFEIILLEQDLNQTCINQYTEKGTC